MKILRIIEGDGKKGWEFYENVENLNYNPFEEDEEYRGYGLQMGYILDHKRNFARVDTKWAKQITIWGLEQDLKYLTMESLKDRYSNENILWPENKLILTRKEVSP